MTEILKEFEQTLIRAREIFLEENTILKAGRLGEHAALLAKKESLLKELAGGLEALRRLREQKIHGNKETIRRLQDGIMKLLMLDKENEQLLLKNSMNNFTAAPKVSSATLEKLYKAL
jgi:hypothetical protein